MEGNVQQEKGRDMVSRLDGQKQEADIVSSVMCTASNSPRGCWKLLAYTPETVLTDGINNTDSRSRTRAQVSSDLKSDLQTHIQL